MIPGAEGFPLTPREGEFSSKPEYMWILNESWVPLLFILRNVSRYIDHAQYTYFLIPLFDIFLSKYHLLEQSGVSTSIPLNEFIPVFQLFNYFANMHHFLQVCTQVSKLFVLVFCFVLILFVEKGSVYCSCVHPLLFLFESERDV